MNKLFRAAALTLMIFGASSITSCATHRETTRTTTVTPANASESNQPTTTTTTVTTDDRPDSVLGATLHAVGTVILFPFRLVGDAIGLLV
jgi:hypothetical protein